MDPASHKHVGTRGLRIMSRFGVKQEQCHRRSLISKSDIKPSYRATYTINGSVQEDAGMLNAAKMAVLRLARVDVPSFWRISGASLVFGRLDLADQIYQITPGGETGLKSVVPESRHLTVKLVSFIDFLHPT